MSQPSIIFVHQNYPAQFGKLAKYMVKQGWDVYFATAREEIERNKITTMDGVKVLGFEPHRESTKGVHRYAQPVETAIINAQAFAQLGVKLRNSGINPDIVVAHSGWGSGAFAKTIWPDTKYVQYLEWWYTFPGRDAATPLDPDREPHLRANAIGRNLTFLLDYQSADAVWVPTQFQAVDVPDFVRSKMRVAFDGVDTDFLAPQDFSEALSFKDTKVQKDDLVLTYATRGMEPQRGFPDFMEALSILQKKRDDFVTLIAGEDTIHYSEKLANGKTYKSVALEKHEFDYSRLHFVGRQPFPSYRDLLARSNVHVYLTRPFVTSWSLFESASAGCGIVCSDGSNTREVLPKDDMAKFVEFGSVNSIVEGIEWMLDHQEEAKARGCAAREEILRKYAQSELYPAHIRFFEDLIAGRAP